jgi:hypothetical protein
MHRGSCTHLLGTLYFGPTRSCKFLKFCNFRWRKQLQWAVQLGDVFATILRRRAVLFHFTFKISFNDPHTHKRGNTWWNSRVNASSMIGSQDVLGERSPMTGSGGEGLSTRTREN